MRSSRISSAGVPAGVNESPKRARARRPSLQRLCRMNRSRKAVAAATALQGASHIFIYADLWRFLSGGRCTRPMRRGARLRRRRLSFWLRAGCRPRRRAPARHLSYRPAGGANSRGIVGRGASLPRERPRRARTILYPTRRNPPHPPGWDQPRFRRAIERRPGAEDSGSERMPCAEDNPNPKPGTGAKPTA